MPNEEELRRRPPRTSAVPAWSESDWLLTGGMTFVIWMAFLPALANGWVAWDDGPNLYRNPDLRDLGWPGLKWAWTTDLLGVYQPLAWMLFEAEYAVGGLEPSVYHGTSLILHIADAILLSILIRVLFARCLPAGPMAESWGVRTSTTLAVTLFAVHPLRVEVVAWASCQPYLLCTLFLLIAVLAYLRACAPAGPDRRPRLALSLAAFAAALLSKAPALILPAVLVVLDVYPLRRLGGRPGRWFGLEARRVWREKLPFLALSILFGMIAVRAKMEVMGPSTAPIPGLGWRSLLAGQAAGDYLVKTFFPFGLAAVYMPPTELSRPLLISLGVAGVTATAFALRWRWPAPAATWAVYLAALVPSAGLTLLGGQIAADRSSYIASIAGVPLLAYGLSLAGRRRGPCSLITFGVAVGTLVALIPVTWRQCRTWSSSEALWTQVVISGGARSVRAHRNLGDSLLHSGRTEEAIRAYERARAMAMSFLARHPHRPRAESAAGDILGRLGNALAAAGRFEEACDAYGKAIEHQSAALADHPGEEKDRRMLGDHFYNLARLEVIMGRPDEAIRSSGRSRDLRAGLVRQYPAEESFRDALRRSEDQIRELRAGSREPAP
jgi:hypothetical protein